jgi:hypothetical protein
MFITAMVTVLLEPPGGGRPPHPAKWRKADVELWARGGWRAEEAIADIPRNGIAFAMIWEQLARKRALTGSNFGPILDIQLRVLAHIPSNAG